MRFFIPLLALTTSLLQALPQEDHLVGHWAFEGNAANSVMNKLPDGTLEGGAGFSSADAISGSYLNLDGVDDYVDIGDGDFFDDLNSEWSAAVWFRSASAPNSIIVINGPDIEERFAIFETSPNFPISLGLRPEDGSNTNIQVFTSNLQKIDMIVPRAQVTEWNHVLVTYSNDEGVRTLTTYLNGTLQTSRNVTDDLVSSEGFHIGTFRDANGRWFRGGIDEMALWDVELTAADARALNSIVVTTLDDEDDGVDSFSNLNDISLREAINHSNPRMTITFDPSFDGGIINLSMGQLTIDKSLNIDASNLSKGIIIDANATDTDRRRVMEIEGFSTVSIDKLTFTGGWAAVGGNGSNGGNGGNGGGILNNGVLSLTDCTISGNRAGSGGTGGSGSDGGSGGNGGGINSNGELNLTRCTVSGNQCGNGGNGSDEDNSRNGGSGGNGGGISSDGSLSLNFCTISGNQAGFRGLGFGSFGGDGNGGNGGGVRSIGTLSLTSCTVSRNKANDGDGSGVFSDTEAIIDSCIIAGNLSNGVNQQINNFSSAEVDSSFIDGDPMLAPLGYYGGPTQTMHPLTDSPVIQLAVNTRRGQRGFDVNGPLTIGAVQISTPTKVNNEAELRAELASANSTPGKVICFNSNLNGTAIELGSLGQLLVPSNTNGLFIDGSNLSNGLTLDANATETNRRRVLQVSTDASIVIHNLTFTGGWTRSGFEGDHGGGISSRGKLTLSSCTITKNQTGESNNGGFGGDGGGIYSRGTLILNSCMIIGNQAGGAFEDNPSSGIGGSGGGIRSIGALTLSFCTISGNQTGDSQFIAGSGGGISSSGIVTLSFCTISGNQTGAGFNNTRFGMGGGSGGGISSTGALILSSCTISGNQTGAGFNGSGAGDGGGIASDGTLTLSSCTISENQTGVGLNGSRAGDGGGVRLIGSGNSSITNTIIAGNRANNLSSSQNSLVSSSNIIDEDVLLAPLGDYGGPTETMLPIPGSPAINAGTDTTGIDQRGFSITDGARDIGAVEVQGAEGEAILASLWTTDVDNDGIPFGLEFTLGTDFNTPDASNPRNLDLSFDDNGNPILNFGKSDADLPQGITLRVFRSTTLEDGSFVEIGTYNTDDDSLTTSEDNTGDVFSILTGGITEKFSFTDADQPALEAFYRLSAEYDPN